MPPVQTTYNQYLAPAVAGMTANMEWQNIVSRGVQAVTMGFGQVALQGTTDKSIQAVGGTGAGPFLGITVLDLTVRPASGIDMFAMGDVAPVMLKGVIWVKVAVAVTPKQPAYYDTTGNFTNVTTGNTAIPGGTFDTTAAAGALAILRLV